MNPAQATAVYDVLVREAGAPGGDRTPFVYHMTAAYPRPFGYTIGGELCFGAVFRPDPAGWRLSYPPKKRTPERDEIIARVNARLLEMWEGVK